MAGGRLEGTPVMIFSLYTAAQRAWSLPRSFALPTTNDDHFHFGGAARSILETRFPCSSGAGFLRLPRKQKDGACRSGESRQAASQTIEGAAPGGKTYRLKTRRAASGRSQLSVRLREEAKARSRATAGRGRFMAKTTRRVAPMTTAVAELLHGGGLCGSTSSPANAEVATIT